MSIMGELRKNIPPSVLKRLTKYYPYIQELREQGVEWISSHQIAERLGLTSSTVRQDLSYIDFSGISQRGYETSGFQQVLCSVLGADISWKLVVVGAGNLGQALALHGEFARRGFNICGIFDSDPGKIGQHVGSRVIQDVRDIPPVVGEKKVDIGVIAVPSGAAQAVADLLVASGVKGILNFTVTHLTLPDRVNVVEARIVASLLELSYAIKNLPAPTDD